MLFVFGSLRYEQFYFCLGSTDTDEDVVSSAKQMALLLHPEIT